MNTTSAPATRYHGLWVAAHWLTGILIGISLYGGMAVLRHIDNLDPEKATMIRAHAIGGFVILVLLLLRLAMRATTRKPPPADTGSGAQKLARRVVHVGLYLVAIAMVSTGVGTLAAAGAFPAVFEGTGALPASFWDYPPRQGHMFFSRVLLLLVAVHVGAALWHQFVRRDGLLRRMWFGPR
ncbi:MAG: cytochrome b/b6 domain-containing protein [Steroidobacteraceae bacterium]|jgi:cytochrome b561|nr:cytochrome b/b6 domain-containing protein [Steroidobacteraceae bacterium]